MPAQASEHAKGDFDLEWEPGIRVVFVDGFPCSARNTGGSRESRPRIGPRILEWEPGVREFVKYSWTVLPTTQETPAEIKKAIQKAEG